jgi:exosortase D (VPLPA-CTERM-specific)
MAAATVPVMDAAEQFKNLRRAARPAYDARTVNRGIRRAPDARPAGGPAAVADSGRTGRSRHQSVAILAYHSRFVLRETCEQRALHNMRQLRLASTINVYWLLAIAILVAAVTFAHTLGSLYDSWNLQPEYSHGLIIPLLSAFLIWRQRAELLRMPLTGSWLGVVLIVGGLLMRVLGERTTMHTLEHYGFLLVLYGLILALTGPEIFRRLWMPLLMLLFAVPLPSLFNNELSLQLQLLSSAIGVALIRMAGVSVLLEGNIIDLGTYQLQVAEACSGLRYLFPLMTLAFIVAYLFRGPLWKRIAIFLASIPITVLMNSLRIALIGITVDRWGPAMAQGALHGFEGWLMFMCCTGALVLTALLLARVGASRTSWGEAFDLYSAVTRPAQAAPREAGPGRQTAPGTGVPRPFIAAAALVVTGALLGFANPKPVESLVPPRASFDQFPTRLGDWVGRRDVLQSVYLDALRLDDYVLAEYHSGESLPVNFYAAYYEEQNTTRAIHSPNDCIPGGGWEITKLERRTLPSSGPGGAFQVNRAVIQLGSDRRIVYFWYQERGRRLTSTYAARWYLFWDALTRHRTDGALVRFIAPLPPNANEAEADASIKTLAGLIEPTLSRYIPN